MGDMYAPSARAHVCVCVCRIEYTYYELKHLSLIFYLCSLFWHCRRHRFLSANCRLFFMKLYHIMATICCCATVQCAYSRFSNERKKNLRFFNIINMLKCLSVRLYAPFTDDFNVIHLWDFFFRKNLCVLFAFLFRFSCISFGIFL